METNNGIKNGAGPFLTGSGFFSPAPTPALASATLKSRLSTI